MPAADIPQDHESRSSLAPALPLVWTGGTATDRIETIQAVVTVNPGVVFTGGELNFQPVRFAAKRIHLLVPFFAVLGYAVKIAQLGLKSLRQKAGPDCNVQSGPILLSLKEDN